MRFRLIPICIISLICVCICVLPLPTRVKAELRGSFYSLPESGLSVVEFVEDSITQLGDGVFAFDGWKKNYLFRRDCYTGKILMKKDGEQKMVEKVSFSLDEPIPILVENAHGLNVFCAFSMNRRPWLGPAPGDEELFDTMCLGGFFVDEKFEYVFFDYYDSYRFPDGTPVYFTNYPLDNVAAVTLGIDIFQICTLYNGNTPETRDALIKRYPQYSDIIRR